MKKNYIILLVFVFSCAAVSAQEFKKFKVGLGLGYAVASGSGAKGGILLYLEPAYRLSDAFSLGLRIESAILTRGFSESVGSAELDIAGIGSYTINGQYYFSNNSFRPFVGLGLGIFSLAAVKVEDFTALDAETKFGVYPRVGFDAGHFNMSVDYNIIPKSEYGPGNFKNSYLGIRIGFSIGGGRLK